MSSFSTSQLEKKLKVMTMSQQSIQTLSLWCIHHRKHARTVVQTWLKDILRGNQQCVVSFWKFQNISNGI